MDKWLEEFEKWSALVRIPPGVRWAYDAHRAGFERAAEMAARIVEAAYDEGEIEGDEEAVMGVVDDVRALSANRSTGGKPL